MPICREKYESHKTGLRFFPAILPGKVKEDANASRYSQFTQGVEFGDRSSVASKPDGRFGRAGMRRTGL